MRSLRQLVRTQTLHTRRAGIAIRPGARGPVEIVLVAAGPGHELVMTWGEMIQYHAIMQSLPLDALIRQLH